MFAASVDIGQEVLSQKFLVAFWVLGDGIRHLAALADDGDEGARVGVHEDALDFIDGIVLRRCDEVVILHDLVAHGLDELVGILPVGAKALVHLPHELGEELLLLRRPDPWDGRSVVKFLRFERD